MRFSDSTLWLCYSSIKLSDLSLILDKAVLSCHMSPHKPLGSPASQYTSVCLLRSVLFLANLANTGRIYGDRSCEIKLQIIEYLSEVPG